MHDVTELLQNGWQLHQAGDLAGAELFYQRALAGRSQHPDALYLFGLLRHDQGRFEAAIEHLRNATTIDPSKATYHAELAAAYRAAGQPQLAVASYRQAIKLSPQFAAAHNNLGNVYRQLGQVHDAIACYEAALAQDAQLADAHNNLGTAYNEIGYAARAVECFEKAVAARPDFAIGYLNLGSALHGLQRFEPALAAFETALRLEPSVANIHYKLALTCQDSGQIERARGYYQQTLSLDPRFVDAAYQWGFMESGLSNSTAAEQLFLQALQIDADYQSARFALGQEYGRQGRVADALACYGAVLAADEKFAQGHLNRAMCWLQQGDFARGWEEYEWRWQCPWTKRSPFKQALWDGSPLAGRTILVHAEQGLGDTLQFVRYLPMLAAAGGDVVFMAPPPLAPLLQLASLPGRVAAWGEALPVCDVRIPLLSLPRLFSTNLETIPAAIPYLVAEPTRVERWQSWLAKLPGLKVGINWQGKSDTIDGSSRSIPPVEFAALSTLPGVSFISLQKGPAAGALLALGPPPNVTHLPAEFDEQGGAFMDTAGLMMGLDLVITSDTAIAHLAGGLGIPVWLVLSIGGDWRWLQDRTDTPWYSTMRLWRQSRLHDWSEVFARLRVELAQLKPLAV